MDAEKSGLDLDTVEVIPFMPDYRWPGRDPIPSDLVGSTIVRFGSVADPESVSGGGLVIDYRTPNSSGVRRIAFAFNERCMWAIHERD
jgi:hypothetical protein